MRLLVMAMSQPGRQVEIISRQIPSISHPNGISVKLMCIGGQLLTEPEVLPPGGLSAFALSLPQHVEPEEPSADALVSQLYGHFHLEKLVDEFYVFACDRFRRYYGIKGGFAYLYIKEAEFVFNERDCGERCRLLKGMKI